MFRDQVFLEMAVTLGSLGTCSRAQVGCIITRGGRAISWGYNGAPPGMPHCNENNHGWGLANTYYDDEVVYGEDMGRPVVGKTRVFKNPDMEEHGCRNATHAEANALAFAARQGISTDAATLYVERSPCEGCARLCIAAGIARVMFRVLYRDESGVTMLREAGVKTECLS